MGLNYDGFRNMRIILVYQFIKLILFISFRDIIWVLERLKSVQIYLKFLQ